MRCEFTSSLQRKYLERWLFCTGDLFLQRSFYSTSWTSECSTLAQTYIKEFSLVAVIVKFPLRGHDDNSGGSGDDVVNNDDYSVLNSQVLG